MRTTDITSGGINWESVPFCTLAPDNVKNYLLKEGDILISRAGSVGANILIKNPDYAVFASYLIRFVPNQEIILPEYMHYFLQSPAYWNKVRDEKAGVALANLNAKKISAMPIPLPPIDKQKEIAAFIESLFGRLGVVKTAITVQKQKTKQCLDSFLSMAVNHVADSVLPHDWQWSTVGEVSKKVQYGWTTKANFNAGKLKLLRTTDITSGDINWKSVPCCTVLPDNVENYLLKEGDILISRAGSVGENILIKNPDHAVFASYLIRFVPNQEIILPEYMHYFLQSPAYWNKVRNEKSGIALANLNAKKISAMPIPLPPLKKQKQIVDKADKLLYNLGDATNRICAGENLIQMCRHSALAVFMKEEERNGI